MDNLRNKLTNLQYQVTQEQGTEPAFTGEYYKTTDPGTYLCVCCGEALFLSESKYDSGSGWPSFFQPVSPAAVGQTLDESHGMVREEVHCQKCGAHLGHVFPDGPQPTGLRYCVNSASLQFKPTASDS